jgi:hypothetical protein
MDRDFYVWTFIYDVSGIQTATLKYRVDADGVNPLTDNDNETYAGGAGVGVWQSIPMAKRAGACFVGNIYNDPDVTFDIMPQYIADEYYAQITGFSNTLLDYYVEAVDGKVNIAKSDIQHVWVGDLSGNGGEYKSAYNTVHVPGDNSQVFGSWWDPNGADNEMMLVADYTWRWQRCITEATSVEYKFAMDGSWGVNRGLGSTSGPDLPQNNSLLSQDGPNIAANLPAGICVWQYNEDTETSKLYVKSPCDFNADGVVDLIDLVTLCSRWLEQDCNQSAWCNGTDLNYNGSVDLYDLAGFAEHWLLDINQ